MAEGNCHASVSEKVTALDNTARLPIHWISSLSFLGAWFFFWRRTVHSGKTFIYGRREAFTMYHFNTNCPLKLVAVLHCRPSIGHSVGVGLSKHKHTNGQYGCSQQVLFRGPWPSKKWHRISTGLRNI